MATRRDTLNKRRAKQLKTRAANAHRKQRERDRKAAAAALKAG
jgi:hypothetical protein